MPDEETKPKVQVPIMLAEIISEINRSDPDAFPPIDPVDPREVVIGSVQDPFIRKIFSLQCFYRREAGHAAIDQRYSDSTDDNAARRYAAKCEMLTGILWWMIHETYLHHPDHPSGIRRGWILVRVPPDNMPPGLRELLGGLGGQ
jgi:hypothetical protein